MNIDTMSGSFEDYHIVYKDQIPKVNQLMDNLMKRPDLADINEAAVRLLSKLELDGTRQWLKENKFEIDEKDIEFIKSVYFAEYCLNYTDEKIEQELREKNQESPESQIINVIKFLTFRERMDRSKIKETIKQKMANHPSLLAALDTEQFDEIYDKYYREMQDEVEKQTENRVLGAWKGLWAADFGNDNETGQKQLTESVAHQKVIMSQVKFKKQMTAVLGFKEYVQEKFEEYISSPKYWQLFGEVKQKFLQEEQEMIRSGTRKIMTKLIQLAEQDQLDQWQTEFKKPEWTGSPIKKQDEILRRLLWHGKILTAKNVEELQQTKLFQSAMRVATELHKKKESPWPSQLICRKNFDYSDLIVEKDESFLLADINRVDSFINHASSRMFNIQEKDGFGLMQDVDRVAVEEPEKLSEAVEATYRLAKYYYLKHRRPDNVIPWKWKCVLRKRSFELMTQDEFIQFWQDPESKLYDPAQPKLMDRMVMQAENVLEYCGLDCELLSNLKDVDRKDIYSLIGIRANFINNFYNRILSDWKRTNKIDYKNNQHRYQALAFLLTSCVTNLFDQRAGKMMLNADFDINILAEYAKHQSNWLSRKWPKLFGHNRIETDRGNIFCEKIVDKMMIGEMSGQDKKTVFQSIFGQLMDKEMELSQWQEEIYEEAKFRYQKQKKWLKKTDKPEPKKYSLADINNMSLEEQAEHWRHNQIEFKDFAEQVDFEWDMLKPATDAEMSHLIQELRVYGRRHSLKQGGEIENRVRGFYLNIMKKHW